MAIDFQTANSTRRYEVPNSSDLHLPDTDWTIATLLRPQDVAVRKSIVSMGHSGANTFLSFIHDDASSNAGFAVRYGTLTEMNWGGGDVVPDVYYWQYTARRGNNIYVGAAEFGGGAASEGAPVDYGSQSIQPTADMFIGAQGDENPARYMQGQIDRVVIFKGYGMTLADAQTLSGGTLPENAAFAASIDINFFFTDSSAASITDSVSSLVATKVNTGWGANEATPYGSPPPTVTKGIEFTLKDDQGAIIASQAGIHMAFFDQPSPGTFTAPVFTTTTGATDASGVVSLDLDADTSLNVGGNGYLSLYIPDAGDHRLSKVFSSRMTIIDLNA